MIIVENIVHRRTALSACLVAALACGGDTGTEPINVTFGETTFVVLVNPIVNDANNAVIPLPGATQSGVTVSAAGAASGTTDANGILVLSPVTMGTDTLALSGGGVSGELAVSIAEKDLREVAIALDGTGAAVMANIRYAFGAQVVEVTSSTPLAEVNAALTASNTIVFFSGGTYTGDLEFRGTNVTLFGEGDRGGQVTLTGNVTVLGDGNRLRGVRITGDLTVPGINAGISFSSVAGAFDFTGDGGTLLYNAFCGTVSVTADDATLLGNAGLDPIPASTAGC